VTAWSSPFVILMNESETVCDLRHNIPNLQLLEPGRIVINLSILYFPIPLVPFFQSSIAQLHINEETGISLVGDQS